MDQSRSEQRVNLEAALELNRRKLREQRVIHFSVGASPRCRPFFEVGLIVSAVLKQRPVPQFALFPPVKAETVSKAKKRKS